MKMSFISMKMNLWRNKFSYEQFVTKTRSDKEAKGSPEMVFFKSRKANSEGRE